MCHQLGQKAKAKNVLYIPLDDILYSKNFCVVLFYEWRYCVIFLLGGRCYSVFHVGCPEEIFFLNMGVVLVCTSNH